MPISWARTAAPPSSATMAAPQTRRTPAGIRSHYLLAGITRIAQFERERCPEARPVGVGARGRRDHMYGLDQPHSARRSRNRTRPSVSVRADCFSEGFSRLMATTSAPASGRFSYVRRTGRSSPARDRVRVPFGHKFERKTERPVGLRRGSAVPKAPGSWRSARRARGPRRRSACGGLSAPRSHRALPLSDTD